MPLIGRREELLRVIRVLERRTKSNPVLIGEAGTGKTALVGGLAQRVADGKCLPGRRIIQLDLAGMLAGARLRGDFEERVRGVLAQAAADPRVILFLDEIHTLAGAGAAEGAMDAGNMLKPALAGGDLRCIGATTLAEYRRHIEADPALERRFQPVLVREPTPEEALEILAGLRSGYEDHHGVRIDGEALEAAVWLTVRHVPERQLPDKAIDVLDDACVRVRIPELSRPDAAGPASSAAHVTAQHVAEVVAEWTGVPVVAPGPAEADRLARLEDALRERIVGQDEAIARIAACLRRSRMRLRDRQRPAGVLLLAGPTGVGNTETAKALAEILFGDRHALIRLDMSEYQEAHAVARLLGAPPGYVGHDEEGQLTGKLRTMPWSVVLLDEVEKAHPRVHDVFLQLFGEGRITDARGRTVLARDAVFVMTGNWAAPSRFGFRAEAATGSPPDLRRRLREVFRPEFIDRVDEIVIFGELTRDHLLEIAERVLGRLADDLAGEHAVFLQVGPGVTEAIVGQAGDEGARGVERAAAALVTDPLAAMLLDGRVPRGAVVSARWVDDRVELDIGPGGEEAG